MEEDLRVIADAIEEAGSRSDMARLLQTYSYDQVNAAWKLVSPLQRAALSFVRNFDAHIAHDLDDLPIDEVFPGSQPAQSAGRQHAGA
jgi:hypothetical protein